MILPANDRNLSPNVPKPLPQIIVGIEQSLASLVNQVNISEIQGCKKHFTADCRLFHLCKSSIIVLSFCSSWTQSLCSLSSHTVPGGKSSLEHGLVRFFRSSQVALPEISLCSFSRSEYYSMNYNGYLRTKSLRFELKIVGNFKNFLPNFREKFPPCPGLESSWRGHSLPTLQNTYRLKWVFCCCKSIVSIE